MSEDAELEVLLSLDGASWEAAEGYMVEFRVHRTQKTEQRPHGINYALVFRLAGGEPFVRFDNAHAAKRPGGRFVRLTKTHDRVVSRGTASPRADQSAVPVSPNRRA